MQRVGKNSFLRLAADDVATADILLGIPSFVRPHKARGRKAIGLRYEDQVKTAFAEKHDHFVAGPWFRYTLRGTPNRCNYAQPDGLFVDPHAGLVIIAEVKYAHTADAYFQLVDKYLPIVARFFSTRERMWNFAVVEVCRWYDAATQFPTTVRLLDDPLAARPGFFGVHIARP